VKEFGSDRKSSTEVEKESSDSREDRRRFTESCLASGGRGEWTRIVVSTESKKVKVKSAKAY